MRGRSKSPISGHPDQAWKSMIWPSSQISTGCENTQSARLASSKLESVVFLAPNGTTKPHPHHTMNPPPKTKLGRPLGTLRTSPAEMIARYPEAVALLRDGYSANQTATITETSRNTMLRLRRIILAEEKPA